MTNLTLLERLQDALSIARGRPPLNLLKVSIENKDSPYRFENVSNGRNYERWDDKFTTYAKEGFTYNSLVYAAIMYKARATATPPVLAYQEGTDEPLPTTHEISKLLRTPNSAMSGRTLQALRSVFYSLSGNSYIYVDRGANGMPIGLYPLRPDRVYIIPVNQEEIAYAYIPRNSTFENAIPILSEDMIHDKQINPLDDFEGAGLGLSPLSASAMSADVDNKMSKFLNNLVDNGVLPTGMLISDNQLTDKDAERMRRRFRDKYGGVNSWADVMVLDKRVTYQRIGMTLSEMVVDNLDKRNEARILQTLGVSPILMGALLGMENSTYANYQESRTAFWEDVMLYELGLFEDELDQRLSVGGQYYYRHDLTKVPALQEDISDKANAARTLWSMGTPLNLAMQIAGIETEPIEGGDIPYINGMITGGNDEAESERTDQEITDTDTEGEALEETDQEERNIAILPREAIKGMIARQADLIASLPGDYHALGVFYDTFKPSQYEDIFNQYGINPNLSYFEDLNNQLKNIVTSIAKSGYATQQAEEVIKNTIRFILLNIADRPYQEQNIKSSIVSDSLLNQIATLENAIKYGNVAKAHTTILFTDGEVIITDADVDEALEDVKDDDLLYGLLTSTIEEDDDE